MKRKINKPLLLFIAFGICIIIYFIYLVNKSTTADKRNPMQVSLNLPDEYANLFDTHIRQKLTVQSAVSFKLRNPVCYLVYDNNYDVEITKINTTPFFDFNTNIVILKNKKISDEMADAYLPSIKTNLTTHYNPMSSNPVSNIYISFSGDSIANTIKVDSLVSYFLKLKEMDISYKPGGIKEIFVNSTNDSTPSVDVAFFKRNNTVYYILVAPKNNNTKLEPDFLNKMLLTKE